MGFLVSRELTFALDSLGVDRGEYSGTIQLSFGGATLARNLPAALELYADILRRPHQTVILPDLKAGHTREVLSLRAKAGGVLLFRIHDGK